MSQDPTTSRPRRLPRLLFAVVWVVTAVALLYAIENWRGRRAWAKQEQELRARGLRLDLEAFIPAPVPEAQNFAAAPMIHSWFAKASYRNADSPWNDNYGRVAGTVSPTSDESARNGARHRLDLEAWAAQFERIDSGLTNEARAVPPSRFDPQSRSNAALAVLEGISNSEGLLTQLRAASSRPSSRYPVDYKLNDPWAILLPHLSYIKAACQRLQLRACAHLAASRPQNALDDIQLMLYLADSVEEEPFLISYLVRLACLQIAIQPIWEGLNDHRWESSQLEALQQWLQRYALIEALQRPLAAEHAAGLRTSDLIRERGVRYLIALGSPGTEPVPQNTFASFLTWVIPSGWYYQEKRNYSRLFHAQQQPLLDTFASRRAAISPAKIQSATASMERELGQSSGLKAIFGHRVVAGLLLPALGRVAVKAAAAQAAVDQAAMACALERYRLVRGELPEALESLAPQFIAKVPHDPVGGGSYKYRTGDDRFTLYSVGWNESDDNGVPGKRQFDEQVGDWVW